MSTWLGWAGDRVVLVQALLHPSELWAAESYKLSSSVDFLVTRNTGAFRTGRGIWRAPSGMEVLPHPREIPHPAEGGIRDDAAGKSTEL